MRRLLLIGAAFAAALASSSGTAFAATASLTLNPTSAAPSDAYTPTYNAGSPCSTQLVDFTFDGSKLSTRPIESPGCMVSAPANVPSNVSPGPHQVCAGPEGGAAVCATLTVASAKSTGPAVPPANNDNGASSAPAQAQGQATSGGSPRGLLAVLGVLILAGWGAAYFLYLKNLGLSARLTQVSAIIALVLAVLLFLGAALAGP